MPENIHPPKPPKPHPHPPHPKKPGYCGVIVVAVIVGLITSLIVGITTSGLGKLAVEKLQGKEIEKTTERQLVEEESSTISAVEKTRPAVVSIIVTKDLNQYYQQSSLFDDPFFEQFFGDMDFDTDSDSTKQKIGGGTGFIITADGLILTNRHVVSDTSASYTVIDNNDKEYEAQVMAIDPTNDIALLKIDTNDLPTVELGDSSSLKIGQTVIAIGYTLGEYHNTVTKGVVSGLGRAITAGSYSGQSTERLENIIQTDAAINSGNSGGPLLTLDGKVIGINTAVDFSGQSVGFAIPINDAKNDIESVKAEGKIVTPYLGVRYTVINKKIAEANGLKYEYGALVARGESESDLAVIPGSPADKAGLVENDIILEIDGEKIDEDNGLAKAIQKHKVGDEVKLKVYHKEEEKEVTVKLEERES
ncbi:MAG: trypsin-like peptidase domain-containing protein [Parcubacteria group bacterium]|nr:trypsin-like peptidase domain-containing protein [Parcubacteria group bacterium]